MNNLKQIANATEMIIRLSIVKCMDCHKEITILKNCHYCGSDNHIIKNGADWSKLKFGRCCTINIDGKFEKITKPFNKETDAASK